MRFTLAPILVVLALPARLHGQPEAEPPGATALTAVAYVEVGLASVDAARTALTRYRASNGAQAGSLSTEVFEQIGRPGHFALIETWRDAAAHAARNPAPRMALNRALEPIRVSGYDERLYGPLSIGATALLSQPSASVFVITHVDVVPDPAVPAMLTALAETSRAETGNQRFDVWRHQQRGNHFTVVEQWLDDATLDAHAAALHTRRYRDALQPLTGSPLDERVFRALADTGP